MSYDIGKQTRYKSWKDAAETWGKKHDLTLKQVYSILSEYDPDNDLRSLIRWAESDEFIIELSYDL